MSDEDFEYARVIGEKLRAARQERQMSLRELAHKASISASMLSQIETGKAYPSVRSIYSIAAALSLPVDYFFPERDDDDRPIDEVTASEMRQASINPPADPALTESVSPTSPAPQVLHAGARPTIEVGKWG